MCLVDDGKKSPNDLLAVKRRFFEDVSILSVRSQMKNPSDSEKNVQRKYPKGVTNLSLRTECISIYVASQKHSFR